MRTLGLLAPGLAPRVSAPQVSASQVSARLGKGQGSRGFHLFSLLPLESESTAHCPSRRPRLPTAPLLLMALPDRFRAFPFVSCNRQAAMRRLVACFAFASSRVLQPPKAWRMSSSAAAAQRCRRLHASARARKAPVVWQFSFGFLTHQSTTTALLLTSQPQTMHSFFCVKAVCAR